MFKTKKYRALERERDKYKADAERLAVELKDANATIQAYKEPPEGCRIGNWCKGCKYAGRTTQFGSAFGHETITTCCYGACEKYEPIPPFTYGCL